MKLRLALAVSAVASAVLPVLGAGLAYADVCPNGTGSLTGDLISSSICVPDGPGGPGTQPDTGGNGTGQGTSTGGSTTGGGGGGSGHNPYRWTRDWLDGDYGTFPRPDCHELPQNNCQDFELGGVSSPLSCTLANGQPGRPYRDTLVNTDTGEVVSQAQGCFDPVTGTSTTANGTPGSGPAPPPPPPTAGEVLQATSLPRQGFGLSPNGRDCSVAGPGALPSSPAPPCVSGEAPGLTGLETLLWVDPPPPVEVSVTVNIRGYSVTTRAHPIRYRWEMRQSGDTASTRNPDSTFDTTTAGSRSAPAARYRWETKGDYRLSLSVVWEGSYTFTGFGVSRTEALGPVTGQATVAPYHVVEVRAVPTAAAP